MSTLTTVHNLDRLKALYASDLFDSFLDNAIGKIVERQVTRDESDLAHLNTQLSQFEEQYGLSSDEFWQRYQAGQMADTADFMEWNILCKMRQRVITRLNILRNGHTYE